MMTPSYKYSTGPGSQHCNVLILFTTFSGVTTIILIKKSDFMKLNNSVQFVLYHEATKVLLT